MQSLNSIGENGIYFWDFSSASRKSGSCESLYNDRVIKDKNDENYPVQCIYELIYYFLPNFHSVAVNLRSPARQVIICKY